MLGLKKRNDIVCGDHSGPSGPTKFLGRSSIPHFSYRIPHKLRICIDRSSSKKEPKRSYAYTEAVIITNVHLDIGQTIEHVGMEGLRGRLASLSYPDHVDPSSAPLVQKLLDDLIRTRQDFVQLKQQAGQHAQELFGVDDKVWSDGHSGLASMFMQAWAHEQIHFPFR